MVIDGGGHWFHAAAALVFSSHIFLFYFLFIAIATYYLVPRVLKHLVITLVSYVFYGWWNPWFMLLMLASTVVDYLCGIAISKEGASQAQRKAALWVSVVGKSGSAGVFQILRVRCRQCQCRGRVSGPGRF